MPSIISGNDNFNSSAAVCSRGQVFTSNGTFTLPAGVSAVKVTVVGGGGNSGAVNSGNYRLGIGGGGGGAAIKYLSGLTSGNTLAVTVGGAGGTSSVASGTQSITTVSATGGATGASNSTSANGALGGSGTNGDINISGGGSTLGFNDSVVGTWMSTGGNSIFGSMQRTRTTGPTTAAAGEAAINYGCGGSGGFRYTTESYPAYAGFQGIVIFEY
jgi:hypothetical protein